MKFGSSPGQDFDDCFADLHALAYRVGYCILGNQAMSEDVASEACARAYSHWHKVNSYAPAWISTVATNLSLQYIKRSKRQHTVDVSVPVLVEHSAVQRADLYRGLLALTKRQRKILVLRYIADLSVEEVAHVLSCSPGTVKSTASRALDKLRTYMVVA